jgi:hypothetical protein
MLSKYILSSNWQSLSCNYVNDSSIKLENFKIQTDGNLNVNFNPLFIKNKDFTLSNYSAFSVTNSINLSSILNLTNIALNENKICLIANTLIDGAAYENTLFIKIDSDNKLIFNSLTNLDNDNFFEIENLGNNEAYIFTRKDTKRIYLCVDEINLTVATLSSEESLPLTFSQLQKARLYVLYNSADKKALFYKVIGDKTYFLKFFIDAGIVLLKKSIQEITDEDFFYVLQIDELPELKNSIDIVSYNTFFNKNNITIDAQKTTYDLKHNFLINYEYNNIKNDINLNILTLKSSLDIKDNFIANDRSKNKREYNKIFGGGNREEGYNNLSLSYTSDFYPEFFAADKTTWFHIPYNNNIGSIPLSSSEFIKSGALPGSSPIFSDKIWKRAAGYKFTSNSGEVQDEEQSGSWLCSWLYFDKQTNSPVWMDRFYNPNIFTPFQALKYEPNVIYFPKYASKYDNVGIADVPSSTTLEPGAWFAYSRFGKKSAKNILKGMDNQLVADKFSFFRNKNDSPLNPTFDKKKNINYYNFNGDSYAIVNNLINTEYNNITISFFATKKDWIVNDTYEIFGNFIDSGLGIFNDFSINPIVYYYNGSTLFLLNDRFRKIQTIDCENYISQENSNIVGLFRKELNTNFFIITKNYRLLEVTADGSVVNKIDFTALAQNKNMAHVCNNLNFGIILFGDKSFLQFDFKSNTFLQSIDGSKIKNVILSDLESENISCILDSFNNIFIIQGIEPILKGSKLYFKNENGKFLYVYNILTEVINTYIESDSDETINSYNFDDNGHTFVLQNKSVKAYDALGNFYNKLTLQNDFSGCSIFELNLGSGVKKNIVHLVKENKNYFSNLDNTLMPTLVDSNFNSFFNSVSSLHLSNFDPANTSFIQSIIRSQYPLPSYTIKLKLQSQLKTDGPTTIAFTILGETLSTGTHHFCLTLDTLKGELILYIDGVVYSKKTFLPKLYSFSNIFTENYVIGSTPFYGGTVFSNFYKSDKNLLFANDFIMDSFKVYDTVLNEDEAKLLYFERNGVSDIHVNLPTGSREYIDTVTRVFKHKKPGNKSNMFNIYINDSLISDNRLQKIYENFILNDISKSLPVGSKINSIKWLNTKDSSEKMIEGNFNTRNTVTDNV